MADAASPGAKPTHSLAQNVPNPFNPDTDVAFSIGTRGRASLKIYDVQGRLVETLVDQVMPPGRHRVHWDGTDRDGRPVASGIYFCRMEAKDFRSTRKMVMIR